VLETVGPAVRSNRVQRTNGPQKYKLTADGLMFERFPHRTPNIQETATEVATGAATIRKVNGLLKVMAKTKNQAKHPHRKEIKPKPNIKYTVVAT
jgi:hypothetical protein